MKLDICNAYYRIRIQKGDKWKTVFRTKFSHYKYLIMLIGLTNIPALWQRLINKVLYKYFFDFVVVYLDNILIYSKSIEEHMQYI